MGSLPFPKPVAIGIGLLLTLALSACSSAAQSSRPGSSAASSASSGSGAKTGGGGAASTLACVKGQAGTQVMVSAPAEPAAGVATPTAACWADIAPTPLFQTVIGQLPSGASASFKTAWAGQDLYVLASVQHWPLNCYDPKKWYDCDAVEIYLGPNDEKTQYSAHDMQLGVTSAGALGQGTNGSAGVGAKAAASLVQGKGYLAELTFPLADAGVNPHAGVLVGFTIAADFPLHSGSVHQSNSTVAQEMWAGTVNNWQDSSKWGIITLQ